MLNLLTAQGATAPTLLGGLIGSNTVNINVPTSTGTGTQTISVPTMSALVNAMQTYADANVVSTPNILTLDNEAASIEVTEEVAVAGQQTITSAVIPVQGSPQYIPAGLKLKITPQIGEADSVMLKIEQELTNFKPVAAGSRFSPRETIA
jgi:general secretion pathway protein D